MSRGLKCGLNETLKMERHKKNRPCYQKMSYMQPKTNIRTGLALYYTVRFFLSVLSEDDVLISAHASTAYVMRYRAGCVPIWSGFEFYFRVWSGAGGQMGAGQESADKSAVSNRKFDPESAEIPP
ncbi:hypothetical protein OUZ56_002073 [Daphnia magna]|uniref:Uncharacterized protein n=1 Tax=Daphnia magna TaxID=35525 RepID=A0ABR0A4L2_9CRUS|nr:hypothetical protein OUZ56_002073 [Daphnia magna]